MSEKKFIPVAVCNLSGNEKKYVLDCLDTTWISSNGKYVNLLEEELAKFCDVKHAIVTCNGTVSLHLVLVALGLQPGDEVIVPNVTYIATANTVKYCGATPVFVDCEPDTWNIDPKKIEGKITSRTKGIMPVHLYGHPCDMDPIMELAKKHNLWVLEDAAEAHGAKYKGRVVGSIGTAGSFSLFGNKIITTGEGGFITTNDDELAKRIRILRAQGQSLTQRYWFTDVGFNYRMTNIAAAIGLGQIEKVQDHLDARQRVASLYKKYLGGISSSLLVLPVEKPYAHHVFWMYTVRLGDQVKMGREEFRNKLLERGIETRPVFHPMTEMPPYEDKNSVFENSALASRGVNLPTHENLTEEDIKFICSAIKELLNG